MAIIDIYVLKSPQTWMDGQRMFLPYKKAEALLYYMVVEKCATRSQIISLLWDTCEEKTAKGNLRHALFTIKKVFQTELLISADRQMLQLNPEHTFRVDYERFLKEKDIELYQEEFLTGFFVKNSYPYEEWMAMKRGMVKDTCLRVIYDKISQEKEIRAAEGELLFERYIREDPLDERMYQRMMEIYVNEHLYYKGIRLYQKLCERLESELGVVPGNEIREFYRTMLHTWEVNGTQKEDEKSGVIKERDRELHQLHRAYHNFLTGIPTFVLLEGEVGVGKTYLAEFFLGEFVRDECLILKTVCLETETQITLQAWNAIMLQIHSFIRKNQIHLSERTLQAADDLFPLFGGDPVLHTSDISNPYSYRIMRNLILKLFEELGEKIPILIFFDNLQYMDGASLNFLSQLVRNENANIMILGTCSEGMSDTLKETLHPLIKKNQVQQIRILPFTREEVRRILASDFGAEVVSCKLADNVYKETKGNALFIRTLLDCCEKHELQDGNILPMEDIWEKRIQALPKSTCQLLEVASACQSWVDMESLVYILKKEEIEIINLIEELKEQGFLCERQEEEEIHFFFCDVRMQKFIHSRLTPSKLKIYHKKLAEYIESRPSYEANRHDRLIYHYQLCGQKAKVLENKILSMASYAYRFYEQYPLLATDGEEQFADGKAAFSYCRDLEDQLLEYCSRNGQTDRELRLHVQLMKAMAQIYIPQGYYEEGRECIERALKSNLLAGNPPKERIRCLRFLIYQQINLWKMEETRKYLDESLSLAEKAGLQEEYAITCRLYGLYLSMTGEYDLGMEYLGKSLDFFYSAPLKSKIYTMNIAACYNYKGEIMRKQQCFEEAEKYYQKAITICEENHCLCNATFYSNLARTLWAMGDRIMAANAFYLADQRYQESFTMIGRSITKGYLSMIEAERRNIEKAQKYLEEAIKSAEQFASPYANGMLALVQMNLSRRFEKMFQTILTETPETYHDRAIHYLEGIPGVYELTLGF